MVGLTLVWGLNQVTIKIANTGYDPVFLMVVRSAIAAALVWLWCQLRGIRLFEADGTLPGGILAGALFGIEFVLIFVGLDYTSAARGVLMINTMPFWVLVGAHFLLGERMSVAAWGGLALAFSGVVLVFSDNLSLPDPSALIGDIMLLAAGALWGATSIVIKRSRLATTSAEKTLLYQLVVSAVVAAPLLAFSGPWLRDPTWLASAMLGFQAVFVVAITFLFWFWMLRRYPAAGLSSFTFLSPVFGVLGGGVLLGEPLSWRIFAALILIAVGLVIVNRPRAQARRTS
ncbi:MAG: DMT family transporter [Rhizobiaceae bacterium]|nr:DMT family transporter [Rhizobiaceae bacterium]MCV0406243.1 DMT family transporter [Rhizobiaceae bacterium]